HHDSLRHPAGGPGGLAARPRSSRHRGARPFPGGQATPTTGLGRSKGRKAMTSHGRPSGGAVVEITDFGWRHAGRKNPAIANITACVEPGERVLLLGASGAGKSTLLAGIAGVLGDAE